MSSHTRTTFNVRSLIMAAAAILCLAIPSTAEAVCSNPSISFAGYYTGLHGYGEITAPSVVGRFWALGFGNPSVVVGNDNGTVGLANWIYPYGGNQILLGTWSQSDGIDGCIEGKIAPGKPSEIMVAEFSDYYGWAGFFAIAAAARDAGNWVQFDFSAVGPDITLANIPTPSILASSRIGPHTLRIRVGGPSVSHLATAFYSDGSVSLSDVILGYRVYQVTLMPGSPVPGVFRQDGWVPLTGTMPLGQPSDVNLECNHRNNFLAVSLVYDSGYESVYLSQKSPEIQCDICLGDSDLDGWSDNPECGSLDCDDADATTHPGGIEINDGKDNQCPGDSGFGVIDEVDGALGFKTPADKNTISWPAQSGATAYQMARSSTPEFAAGCTSFLTASPSSADPEAPPANLAFYYLIRSTAPHTGSWGTTSAGEERTTTCP
jgi:hypothetical protein